MESPMSYIPSGTGQIAKPAAFVPAHGTTDTVVGEADLRAISRAHGLVSALDMLKFFYAGDFAHDLLETSRLRGEIEDALRAGTPTASATEAFRARAKQRLPFLLKHLNACGFKSGEESLQQTVNDLPNLSASDLARDLKHFLNHMEKALAERVYIWVAPERKDWCNLEQGFGPEVARAFPSAASDIAEAGNCYGAGLYTAAVYHSICALEPALKALAKHLKVKWHPASMTWGTALRMTEEKIHQVISPKAKTKADLARRDFLAQAAKEFRYFKEAWRDNTMHARLKDADQGEALRVLEHAKSFMEHLASRLSEPGAKRRDLT